MRGKQGVPNAEKYFRLVQIGFQCFRMQAISYFQSRKGIVMVGPYRFRKVLTISEILKTAHD